MHPTLRARADRQWGLFTASEARSCGYAHGEIRHLLSTGAWVRLRRGVYVTADDLAPIAGNHRVDCLAVLLSLGRAGAAVSHTSAARSYGLPVNSRLDRDVRLTDPDQWRTGTGYRMSRAPLPPGAVTLRGPLRSTSPARTIVDCAREWPLEDAVVATDAALLRRLVTRAELRDAVTAARHWVGSPRAARAVELADGRAESPLETRGRLRILGAGLPLPDLQTELHVGSDLVGVVDGWFDVAALALEFDGRVKYSDPWRGRTPAQVAWEEKRREDLLREVGVRFLRLTDTDVGRGWPRAEERLRRLLDRPGPVDRAFRTVRRTAGVVRDDVSA